MTEESEKQTSSEEPSPKRSRRTEETSTRRAETKRKQSSPLRRRLILGAALGALVVAMLLNTKFLTPEEVAAITPEEFDPAATAQELYEQTESGLIEDPHELNVVVEALAEDPEAAAEELEAFTPSAGTAAYPVTVTGVVEEATEDALIFASDTVSTGQTTTVPLGTAVDGNLIRDLSGFQFGDAPGQTDYQRVGNELGALMQAAAQEAVGSDPTALQGEEITVEGILSYTGTDPDAAAKRPLIIQPLQLEAGQ